MDSVTQENSNIDLIAQQPNYHSVCSCDCDITLINTTGINEIQDELTIESKWEDMNGLFQGFTIEYMVDQSTDWSNRPYMHVFVENPSGPVEDKKPTSEHMVQNQEAIIIAICKHVVEESPAETRKLPQVAFDHGKILVKIEDPAILVSLWRSPPVYGDKTLKLISRGLPWSDVAVFSLSEKKPMTESEIFSACKIFTTLRKNDLINIFVRFYKVHGFPEDSMFTGDLLVFWDNFAQRRMPRLNGLALQVAHYGTNINNESGSA